MFQSSLVQWLILTLSYSCLSTRSVPTFLSQNFYDTIKGHLACFKASFYLNRTINEKHWKYHFLNLKNLRKRSRTEIIIKHNQKTFKFISCRIKKENGIYCFRLQFMWLVVIMNNIYVTKTQPNPLLWIFIFEIH